MTVQEILLADGLSALYTTGTGEIGFGDVLCRVPAPTDAELADLIEADGRIRLRLARPVTLDRYLAAVPDLPERPDALDAAIDMALRALARTGRADEDSVRKLVARYPRFGEAIRQAAELNNAVWSTRHIRRHLEGSSVRELPCDFGPAMKDGRQRYELRELLGEGALGQVYLAVDRHLSEPDHPAFVSIKLLRGQERSALERLQLVDEATKARRINHPNVARVLDRGVSARDEDFLLYEFVEGGDLARWARRRGGAVPVEEAARMVARIARGVHAAHMAGLVHCDLKPNNVVVTADGEPKVTDFGVAIRADGEDRSRREPAGHVPVGNLAFMSPEQYRMEPGALTIPTDVYALGGILCWLLTGQLPNGATPEAIRRTHDPLYGRTDPPKLGTHVDRDLEMICRRAMALRPEHRFGSAAEVAESLEAWLRREPIAWTRPSVMRRFRLWARRKPSLAITAAVVSLVLLGSGTVMQRLASVARQKRFEAAVVQARLEQEEEYRRKFRANLREKVSQLRRAAEKGISQQVLPHIWVVEWMYGPTVLGDGPQRFDLWDIRTDVVRDLVNKATMAGGAGDVRTLIWETALCFWLIHAGHHSEAQDLLAGNLDRWASLLDPRDPWLVHLRAMHACASVGRFAGCDLDAPPPLASPAALEAAATALEQASGSLSALDRGTPLHHLVLTNLAMLYGPDHLDRRERRAEVEDMLRVVFK